jgi:hypothetical protein
MLVKMELAARLFCRADPYRNDEQTDAKALNGFLRGAKRGKIEQMFVLGF